MEVGNELTDQLRVIAKSAALETAVLTSKLNILSECLFELRSARSTAPREIHAYLDPVITHLESRLKELSHGLHREI